MKNKSTGRQDQKAILIFLPGLNFWEGLYDTVNIRFLKNLFDYNLAEFQAIIMTIITPRHLSEEKSRTLIRKQNQIKEMGIRNGVNINFHIIRGRTLGNLKRTADAICRQAGNYHRHFIWAYNYYNGFLGTLIRRKLPGAYLHFELMGLVPEEELYYSDASVVIRWLRFSILKLLESINIKNADSISVVSNRLKDHLLSRYSIHPKPMDVIPCYYDDTVFFCDSNLREAYRLKYNIQPHQKLILYSGMLQKWQMPNHLFRFFRSLQNQDKNHQLRFMMITFDTKRADYFANKHGIKNLIIDSVSGIDLNGVYNAADIGVAPRSSDIVSQVSSPVKIPEYLSTGNALVLLECIGDFGTYLKDKAYCLIKKNADDLCLTRLEEISMLKKPDETDLLTLAESYSPRHPVQTIKQIFERQWH